MSLHHHLKDLLIKNDGEVLQILQKVFISNISNLNEVILQMRALEDLKKDRRNGTLRAEEENLRLRKIHSSILGLIDEITPDEAAAYELENAIFKRILVVCKSPEREEFMRKLFPEDVYKGVEFEISGAPRPASSVNRFDLVVFDNEPSDTTDGPNTLLLHYLDNTAPYLLYFGTTLPLLYKYPAKAYFTNSVFSLHARLDEMITYLKYFERKG